MYRYKSVSFLKIESLFLFLSILISYRGLSAQDSTASIGQTDSSIYRQSGEKTDYQDHSFLQSENITGDWWGFRKKLENSGINFEFIYKGEFFSNVSGGYKQASTTLDNYDLILKSDLEKIMGLSASWLVIQFLGNSGGMPNDFAGTSQGISNIETVPAWKIYQLLFEKKLFGDKLSLLAGLYDLNSEFDARETSSVFINPSHGIGPDYSQSGLNGPSIFPTTSLAIRIKYETESGNYFQAAALDGVPGNPDNPNGTQIQYNKNEGLLLAAEYGIIRYDDLELLDYKVALGTWFYSSEFEKNEFLSNGENRSSFEKNYGIYLSAEKSLLKNDENEILGFFRIGAANKNINPIDYYVGGGIKINGRCDNPDEFGIAFALAHHSKTFRIYSAKKDDVPVKPIELNMELTYSIQLMPWFRLQPDIQYIINPAYCTNASSAFLFGTRVELNF